MKPNDRQIKIAVTIEQFLFPLISFFLAYKNGELVYSFGQVVFNNPHFAQETLPSKIIFAEQFFYHVVLTCFCLLSAYMTIIRRNLKVAPSNYLEIFVPILSTFWFMLYNLAVLLPYQFNIMIMPLEYYATMGMIGGFFCLVGICVTTVALLDLKKSFGVLVQVRDVVTQGLYKHVRHPLYFGYVTMTIGFILLKFTLIPAVLAVGHILIIIWRAKLEEKKMAQHSEEYRAYMQKTPFLFPKL